MAGDRARSRTPLPVRRPRAILAFAALLAVSAAALASRLSVKADLTHLLPPGAASVRDLDEVQRRAQAFGNLLVGIEADDPAARAEAVRGLVSRLRSLDPSLVASVVADDGSLRRHLWNNRYQYIPIEDLEDVRDDLRRRVAGANPLFVDLSDDDAAPSDRLAALRARLDEAEASARSPTPLVSKDGRTQMVIVRATFPSTDASKSRRVNDLVQAAIAATRATAPAGVRIGATGDIATVVVEQNAIVRGMTLATLITTVVVALALLVYYRSLAALAAIFGALGVGTVATLAFARLSVGYLNSATAFLISIVIGNGINFPMLVVARTLEERRRGMPVADAVARAMTATLRGTTAAALTAFVAYGSLIVTDFRGFRDFGIIGAVGMLLCWAAAYSVAPALLTILGRRGLFDRLAPEPSLGHRLAALVPRRSRPVVGALVILGPLLLLLAGRYFASDPFEYNLGNLRASGAEARQAHAWQTRLDTAFGKGISGGFVIAVERPEDVPPLASELRTLSGTTTGGSGPLLSRVSSLNDLLPADQERRFALLQEVRQLIDRHADEMPEETAAEARRLRPPDGLRPLGPADVPAELGLLYTEKDGHRGRLMFANTAPTVNGWDGRDLKTVSRRIRALDLPPGTRVAGSAFVFADMIEAIRRDGPRATLVALIGVLVVIALTMGLGRHGRLTALAAVFGATAMLALSSLAGVKINFLDFVALPLTLGIGNDYAANVLSRAREEAPGAARRAVLTTGGVVVLCSFTTIVGYASLLAADNAGIRSFGLAAMLGELTCVVAGVWVAPVLLEALERRASARSAPPVKGSSWWQQAVMLAGAVFFVVMVRSLPRIDWRALIVRVGPALPVAAAVSLGWMALYARGLQVIVGGALRWGRLVYNRLIGEAYSVITPLADMGGDPVRVMDLAAGVGTSAAVRAIVIDRLVYSTSGLVFSGLSAAVAVRAFAWDSRLERLLTGYALAALAGALLLALLTTRPAAARALAGVLRFAKVRLPEVPSPLPPLAFARALGWHLLGRASALVEIAVLLVALGQPLRPAALIAAGAIISIAGIVFFFIPGGLGVNEGAAVLAMTLSGYSESVGLAVGLARRVRQLLLAGAGVLLTIVWRPGRAPGRPARPAVAPVAQASSAAETS